MAFLSWWGRALLATPPACPHRMHTGALQDNCRAVLAGRQTYGKGLIQSVYELGDGSGAPASHLPTPGPLSKHVIACATCNPGALSLSVYCHASCTGSGSGQQRCHLPCLPGLTGPAAFPPI